MTQTICFNLNDTRLYVSERTYIQNLSKNSHDPQLGR